MRPHSSAEAENRVAFLAQLYALLTQVKMIASSNALSAANKTKLEPIRTQAEEWMTAIGPINQARPSIAPATPTVQSPPKIPETKSAGAGTTPPRMSTVNSSSTLSNTAEARDDEDGGPALASATPPAVDQFASQFGTKNIADLAKLLQLLFSSGIPETVKLRMIGKGIARLVAVRCTSTITAAMGHIIRETYTAAATPAEAAAGDEKDANDKTALFVGLSRDIRLSTHTLDMCLETVIFNSDLSDVSGTRFPLQLCVDVLKQIRKAAAFFQSRVEKNEAKLLLATTSADKGVTPEAHVAARVHALQELWGPSLSHSLSGICSVVPSIVAFLVKVASLKEATAPNMGALAAEARDDLFSYSAASDAGGSGESPATSPLADFPASAAEATVGSSLRPDSGVKVSTILEQAHFSFFADYLCAAAECCGDEGDGQLVATRIVADSLRYLAEQNVHLLRCILTSQRWKKSLYIGILNCVSSLYPAVLTAGLEELHIITTTCVDLLGQEGGVIYGNCVFRLLESENSPLYVKKEIMRHLMKTFLKFSKSDEGDNEPLLLRLYQLYDLNVHAHSLNLVQQCIASFSRIVRKASKSDFAVEEDGDGDGETPSPPGRPGGQLDNHTLPSLALSALVLTVALLDAMAPADDGAEENCIAKIQFLSERERKIEEQRIVDLFNTSPKKAVCQTFGVTEEEMSPEGTADFVKQCAFAELPSPVSDAVQAKIDQVATFLVSLPSLGPEAVAEYITIPAVFPLQVCKAVMERLSLRGKGLIDALNELLTTIQLPKEGQRIERLLEYFCGVYYAANTGPGIDSAVFPFANADVCFVVVIATVMLNTNLHNPLSGMRFTQTMFRNQLRGCNDSKDFEDFFVDEIFLYISEHPLENVRSLNTASLAGGTHNSTVVEMPSRGFDALFISTEERRQLAFAAERQRLVSETKCWLERRSGRDGGAFNQSFREICARKSDARWRCASARDLFLSSWASLCAVFGPAMYEGGSAPKDVLIKCVRGLQSLMCVAAAFALPTECEAMLLALLRMCTFASVRDMCHNAVLTVASTSYAAHFSSRCWLSVFSLMVQLRRQNSSLLQSVESALNRVEIMNRQSCEEEEEKAKGKGGEEEDRPTGERTQAYQHVMEGVIALLDEYQSSDGLGLSAALQYLRRALSYSFIENENVIQHVNVAALKNVVLPRIVKLAGAHKDSEESLQVLTDFLADLLTFLWQNHETVVRVSGASGRRDLIECFDFFKTCSVTYPRAFILQMHLLHCVKDLITKMIRVTDTQQDTYILFSVWRRVLYPAAKVLADNSISSEASSLAVLVLRRLVALCGLSSSGAATASAPTIPPECRSVLLCILANTAYVGGLCSTSECGQACVSHLSTLCAMALSGDDSTVVPHEAPARDSGAPEDISEAFVMGLETEPFFVVRHTLERLCLLLRCGRDQARADVVEHLRTLSIQLLPPHVRYAASLVGEALLEGTVGRASAEYDISLSDPTLISFWLLQVDVPASLRLCSRTAFRVTLPGVLSLVTNELLTAASTLPDSGEVLLFVLERCLLPIAISPNCNYFPTQALAVRSIAQCVTYLLRQKPEVCTPAVLQRLVESSALALCRFSYPHSQIVPGDASFCGRQWMEPTASSGLLASYTAQSQAVFKALGAKDPSDIVESEHTLASLAVDPTATSGDGDGHAGTVSTSSRGARESNAFLRDDQLVEVCSVLVQVLGGLPKVLYTMKKAPAAKTATSTGSAASIAATNAAACVFSWAPPTVEPHVLIGLLLRSVGTAFAILWRIDHPKAMEDIMASQNSNEQTSTTAQSTALLPHSILRGALASYIEIAVETASYAPQELLAVAVELLGGIQQVQSGVEVPTASGGKASEARFSSQEQQYIRTCYTGMYQELSLGLTYWMKNLLDLRQQHPSLSAERVTELERTVVASPRLFTAVVALLSPTAGAVILAARDYFGWYIQYTQPRQDEAASSAAATVPAHASNVVN